MDYPALIGLAMVGIFAGWLNVMAGGGSLLTVPVMLFMGIPAPVANGTNRIGILAQNLAAVMAFFRNGLSDFRLSLSLGMAASVGAIGGAMVGVNLDGVWFDRLLATVMIAVMILMSLGDNSKGADVANNQAPKRVALGHVCMIAAGFWGGMIQIGVGFILMPVLHRMMGLDLVRVNMHKVFIVMIYTVIALVVFASQVEIYWSAGFALAIGMTLGGWLGAHTAVHHGKIWIRRVLFLALSLFIVKLLWP